MENKRVDKEYTWDERLKILENSKCIRIVKHPRHDDVYVPIEENGRTVYVVAEKE